MDTKKELNADDREFFQLVDEAAFGNPFSTDRVAIQQKIAGTAKAPGGTLLQRAVAVVLERVARFESRGNAEVRLYSGKDLKLVRITLLFDAYQRYIADLDALILKQVKAGDEPCPVPFADEVLDLLKQRGFQAGEARHFFAFFYQLRRAFYFIHRSLVGQSPSLEELRCRLWNNIFTYDTRWFEKYLWNRMEDFSTFLLGETGTGKGTAAAAIGRSGFIPFDDKKGCFTESFTRNFIAINLSQFPESLIESELFGHKKGAFTGAVEDFQGVLARCRPHGAIFLDEIGDVSVPVQIKLLQVLQERTFSVVGSHRQQRFHGRVIAATNQPLDQLRQQGAFRDDFFYRLCSDMIIVPPLRRQIREEPRALAVLLAHTIERIIGEPSPELLRTVQTILAKEPGPDYAWPGNVRELEQAVRRILLTRHYSGDSRPTPAGPEYRLFKAIEAGSLDAQELLGDYCALLHRRHGTYEEVARITRLDRRTVKKHIQQATAREITPL